MHFLIYIIALLEGFTTLSVEITALRIFAPIIGVNAISTSIILGVILLALSYGYYRGGVISARGKNIELYLLRNLILSSLYYFFITFIFAELILQLTLDFIPVYFISLLVTSVLLFFIPVFLASQTIPLLSEILKGNHSGEKMGKLLFYSTIGSFVGSVGTSVALFPTIGVQKTAIVSPLLLSICALLISMYIKTDIKKYRVISGALLFTYLFSLFIPVQYGPRVLYNKSNAYHTINIYETGESQRIFSMDQAYSSGIDKYTGESFFHYIQEIKSKILQSNAKNILIIGAAGFTLPNELAEKEEIHSIDVVDIDKDLKDISEEYFLEKILDRKIDFHVQSARYYLNNLEKKQYDSVVVDVYSGHSLPSQVLTLEFFQKLSHISDTIYLNIISDVQLETNFSKKLWETIAQGFGGKLYYKNTNPYNQTDTNFVITNKEQAGYEIYTQKNTAIYTDDKHSIEIDIFNKSSSR